MDRFQAIATFAKIVETGSFARAAERLDLSVSAVSRQVAELEAHLDARLLNRTTRRLSLTESGRAFHERCVQLLADLDEAEQSAHAGTVQPRGTLRLTCAVTFGERYLVPAIGELSARYPEMQFDVELSDRVVDLVEEGFDAAVRIGAVGSQNLVGRKIAGPVHSNSGRLLATLAADGLGIVCEPDFIVAPLVRDGRLVPLLRAFDAASGNIHVVYPSRRHLSAKVRAFAEFMALRCAKAEWALPRES
jgi:DNA-binding transcriptional LysR family regulator